MGIDFLNIWGIGYLVRRILTGCVILLIIIALAPFWCEKGTKAIAAGIESGETDGEPALEAETREALERVKGLAVKREKQLKQAGELAVLAGAWSRINPEKARMVLAEALKMTSPMSRDVRGAAIELITVSSGYSLENRLAAHNWADRLLTAGRAVGPLLVIADKYLKIDKETAEKIIYSAVNRAQQCKNRRNRDLELRPAAALLVQIDRQAAVNIAEAISRPESRSWAYRSMGVRLAGSDRRSTAEFFGIAFQESSRIKSLLRRVQSLAMLANEWAKMDVKAGKMVFTEAAKIAARIKDPDEQSRAFSITAAGWGRIEYRRAFELVQFIPLDYHELRYKTFMSAAEGDLSNHELRSLIEAAYGEAGKIPTANERERAMAGAALQMAGINSERAIEILETIGPENRLLRSEVTARIIKGDAADNLGALLERIEKVDDPYVRADLLTWLAERSLKGAASCDSKEAAELWKIAISRVRPLKDDSIIMELAVMGVDYLEKEALEAIGAVESLSIRAKAFAKAAVKLLRKGKTDLAESLWKKAVARAMEAGESDAGSGAATLKEMAEIWVKDRPERADVVFESAYLMMMGLNNGAIKRENITP